MGSIGNPIANSLIQAAQAQQVASKASDRARNAQAETKQRLDKLELRVDEAEAADAVRSLHDDDEPQEERREGTPHDGTPDEAAGNGPSDGPPDEPRPSLDLQA